MPLIAKIPENASFVSEHGPYGSHLNVLDRKKTAVQRQIHRGGMGSYEPDFQASLLALCERSTDRISLFDVGAHIGVYSALVSTIFRFCNPYVVAFEPTPDTAISTRILRESNNLGYTIKETAISDTHGSVDLFISQKAETSNSLDASFRQSTDSVSVPMTTIDRVIRTDGLVPPTIMKIDVETLEANVLRGAFATIQKHLPVITLEILSRADQVAIGAMLKVLQHFGYVFYQVPAPQKQWRKVDADGALSSLSSQHRDWICTPVPLDQEFFEMQQRWRAALEACDQNSNVIIPAGQAIPDRYIGGVRST